jgi:DTW domain-containing protein YfiP
MPNQGIKINKKDACPRCFRPLARCFCGKVSGLKNGPTVLILQHPQERYKLLNSAFLAHAMLDNSVLKVGLSWRNLSHALGRNADPKQWAVLYLKGHGKTHRPMEIFDNKKRSLSAFPSLEGLVVIDGSWKQAKALWWRNPWLLRLNRIMLNPKSASRRPQAKKEGLSTIEAVALALKCLGEDTAIPLALETHYADLIIKTQANSMPQGLGRPGAS